MGVVQQENRGVTLALLEEAADEGEELALAVEVLDPYRPGGRCEQAEVPPGGQQARHPWR